MTASGFQALVEKALATLPSDILQHLNNVAITVSDWPSRSQLEKARLSQTSQLFGLYEGVPLTKRGSNYHMVTPDRITLFRRPLLAACRSPAALPGLVRRTVVHEIAHHFGISEARIRELGY